MSVSSESMLVKQGCHTLRKAGPFQPKAESGGGFAWPRPSDSQYHDPHPAFVTASETIQDRGQK
jgi:hypothetical protein